MRLALLFLVAWMAPTYAAEITLKDADTLVVDGASYRLHGIDAPEADQQCLDQSGTTWACGIEAVNRLAAYINGRSVRCDDLGPDRSFPQRRLGICYVEGETLTLNAWLVEHGWALNFEPYSKGRFKSHEMNAQTGRRGMWTGCFVSPRDHRFWRKSQAVLLGSCSSIAEETARTAMFPDDPSMPPGCSIKGKFAYRAWLTGHVGIYHTEGCRSYGRTKRNERWFCTEEEAEAADFRKSFTC